MIGLFCTLPSCKDPCKGYGGYYSNSNDLKKHSFKIGSYWVYQDSASGILDSQSVFYYNAQNHVEVGYSYGVAGAECTDYSDKFQTSAASFWNGIIHDSIFWGNIYAGDNILISFSTHQEMYYGYLASDANSTTLTNFSVLGNVFPKVSCSNGGLNSVIYQADNIGIVKWVFNDTINGQRSWNLLRYHVVNP